MLRRLSTTGTDRRRLGTLGDSDGRPKYQGELTLGANRALEAQYKQMMQA